MIKWLYDRYILTGIISLYYMALVGYGTYMLFANPENITSAGSSAYLGLLGLPAAAVALIKWRIEKDNK